MEDILLNTLKLRAKNLHVAVRVGKNTLTETILSEIERQLKKNKIIKIKFLKASMEVLSREEMIATILAETKSIQIERVGNTFTIYRR